MRIGILETGLAPEELRVRHGSYPDMFARLLAGQGFEFRAWRVVAGDFPAGVHDADGWLLTGSRHGAYDDLPFIPRLEAFIRTAYAEGVPLVGICFGHQIIAQALGGRVEKAAAGWQVGPQDYDFGDRTLRLNAWHQDQVTMPPPEARVIASSPACPVAALGYAGPALTVQAHPEFDADFIGGLMETRGRGVVPAGRLEAARARLDEATDAGALAARITEFFHDRGAARHV
ncbi:MAG: type 1 glutamine amidotransferase [Rhodobacteraceae bacterium]|nr:type 1 glutamine amidotransferase [Paracoccaceae bacterium]